MNVSPRTRVIASSLILGVVGFVSLRPGRQLLETSSMHLLRHLSGISTTGFYTRDIGFFTAKPWGDELWSVDFSTKPVKKINELLFSSDGLENGKGSILCTDELCVGHGKASTAVLLSRDGVDGEVVVTFETTATSFELCFTCPPGLEADVSLFSGGFLCETNLGTSCNSIADISFTNLGRKHITRLRTLMEPEPSLYRTTITYDCEEP